MDIAGWSQRAELKLYRILDANLDRAREGIRIIEEWCRFGTDSEELVEECKRLRQEIAEWHMPVFRAARNTPGDVGTDSTHPKEAERYSVQQVLLVNFCRIQEAMRVLEEYGKLYKPQMGEAFKQMRYRVYTLDSMLLSGLRREKLRRSLLYLVTSPHDNLLALVESVLQSGLTLVQYRDKTAADGEFLAMAHALCQLCHRYDALLIVNDRVDIALAVGADGVHLGQQDMPVAIARELLGPDRLVGCSTTNPEELKLALEQGADYVGVGPVYETPTKAGKPASGLQYVKYAAENTPIPWFAIGGVDMQNLNEVLSAGAQRVAVVRAITQAEQPALVTQYFVSQLNRVQTIRNYQARLSHA